MSFENHEVGKFISFNPLEKLSNSSYGFKISCLSVKANIMCLKSKGNYMSYCGGKIHHWEIVCFSQRCKKIIVCYADNF